jgi:plastocyanin
MLRNSLTALMLLAATPLHASDLVVTIRDANGKPVADAVVEVYPAAEARKPALHGNYEEAQQNLTFIPFVLTVPVGATVRFPNRDRVKHQVYSFSAPKAFTLDLYGHDDQRTVSFDKPGTVALGCNIHDAMRAYVRVVDTVWFGQSGAMGTVTVHDLPAGPARLVLWRPYLKTPNSEMSLEITLPAEGTLTRTIGVELRMPPGKSNY